MNILLIMLRIIHIFAGIIWASGSVMMSFFVGPTAKEIGAEARPFMQHLTLRSRFAPAMSVSAVLTVISGIWLYFILFKGINISTGASLALTLGGLFGIIALLIGFFTQKRSTDRLKAIGAEIAAAGGPPQPEQLAEIQSLNEKMAKSGAALTLAIGLSILGMALSEYFAF